MIVTFLVNSFISIAIIGYSYLFKILFLRKQNLVIANLDFLYGLFLIIFTSVILNFFVALVYVKYVLFIIGIIFFLTATYKRKININYLGLILFLFVFSFFTYWNGNNADSPIYHIPTINWIHNHKITFGLAILDWHYALNSVWHIFLSVFSFQYRDFNTLYVINFIPYAFILSEIPRYTHNFKISYLTLFLSLFYILFFSYIHPFNNGIIFNHLGNPEVDTIGMLFFILTGFLFLKYLSSEDKNDYYLMIISSIICPLIKLTYFGSLFFPIVASIYLNKNLKILFNKISFIGSLLILVWLIRNFILSSCFIFPFKFSCFKTSWSLDKDQVLFYLNQTKSFARDAPFRLKYADFEYTIYSFDWFFPWVKNYFFEDAFLKISFFIFTISILFYFILTLFHSHKNKIFKIEKLFFYILILYFLNFLLWFQAPEIRFGWGILVFFPCVFLSLLLNKFNIINRINKNIFSGIIILLCFLLIYKNSKNFKIDYLIKTYDKKFSYSEIVEIKEINGFKIFQSKNWMCADFKGICINKPKKNYFLEYKHNYIFISTTDRKTL